MRLVFSILPVKNPTRLTGNLALGALLAGIGACSNFDSLRSPVFTGSTNQQQIIAGTGQTPLGGTYVGGSMPSGVSGADLPPPPGATSPTAYAAAPQPYTPPQGGAATGEPVQLASADSVQRGAPPTTLNAQAGHMRAAGAPSGASATHLVQSGDTAWNISQRYGITVEELAAANGGSTTVRIGQRIVIPGVDGPHPGVQVASADATSIPPVTPAADILPIPASAAAPATEPAPLAAAQAGAPDEQQVALAPQTGSAGALAPAVPQASASAGFRWPVRGRIISGFGKKANGERNDGINLAVPEGTEVKAAEDGTVIYAGNELKSYGNLVLIRHDGGWVSAYAHNSALQVKRGDKVSRGQTVALSGMSGGVTTPQVHFELRKDATPVDPLQHMVES
jgi:murein DD-endopeptidase MepM/ murein hydrolase activator NlpD